MNALEANAIIRAQDHLIVTVVTGFFGIVFLVLWMIGTSTVWSWITGIFCLALLLTSLWSAWKTLSTLHDLK